MLHSVFGKDIWDRRKSMIWWIIGMVALTTWIAAVYPILRDSDAMTQFLEDMPPEMLALFGMDPATFLTGAGFLQAQLFSFMAPIIVITFSIGMGVAATAREESNGTMDVLLSLPVSRRSVILQKAASMVLLTDVVVLSIAATLVVANPIFGLDLSIEGVAAICLGLWLLAVVFGGFTMLVGAFSGSPSLAGGLGAGFAILAWFVDAFSSLYDWLVPFAKVSPFRWYLEQLPLLNGINIGDAWLAIAAVVLLGGATALFARRNIATDRVLVPRLAGRRKKKKLVKPRFTGLLESVFGKTVWDRRRSIWFWAIGLSTMSFITFAAWPALAEDSAALESLMDSFPKEVLALFGLTDPQSLTTPQGFISSRTYGSVGPIVLIVFGITAMSAFVAREESSGKLDMVLSTPNTRRSVLSQKAMGVVTLISVIAAFLLLVALWGNLQYDLGMDVYSMVAANIGLGLLGLCFWGIAVGLWSVLPGSGPAIGATAAIAVVTYFLNGLGAIVDFLEPFRYISPFYWYLGDTVPLSKGLTFGYLALALVAIGGTLLAINRFETRDLAV